MRLAPRTLPHFLAALILLSGVAYVERGRLLELLRGTGVAPGRTVSQVQAACAERGEGSYEAVGRAAGLAWPPHRLQILAFKEERLLEVWGANDGGGWVFLGEHPILGASGGPGPKRREGDLQVPEGIYALPELNPNSRFHLSIRVGYPNQDDIRNARVPRRQMGGDIFIHGGSASIGCIAIGNEAIEKLFCLAAKVASGRRGVLIAPYDFRRRREEAPMGDEPWVGDLYARLARELAAFRR